MTLQESMKEDNKQFNKFVEKQEKGFWLDDIPKGLTPRQLSAAIHDDTPKYRLKEFKSIRRFCKGVMPNTANMDGLYGS